MNKIQELNKELLREIIAMTSYKDQVTARYKNSIYFEKEVRLYNLSFGCTHITISITDTNNWEEVNRHVIVTPSSEVSEFENSLNTVDILKYCCSIEPKQLDMLNKLLDVIFELYCLEYSNNKKRVEIKEFFYSLKKYIAFYNLDREKLSHLFNILDKSKGDNIYNIDMCPNMEEYEDILKSLGHIKYKLSGMFGNDVLHLNIYQTLLLLGNIQPILLASCELNIDPIEIFKLVSYYYDLSMEDRLDVKDIGLLIPAYYGE